MELDYLSHYLPPPSETQTHTSTLTALSITYLTSVLYRNSLEHHTQTLTVLTPVSRSRFFLRSYPTVYFCFANTSHLLSYRLSISLHSQTHTFTVFETRHTNPRSPPRFPHTLASNLYPRLDSIPASLLTLPPKSILAR